VEEQIAFADMKRHAAQTLTSVEDRDGPAGPGDWRKRIFEPGFGARISRCAWY